MEVKSKHTIKFRRIFIIAILMVALLSSSFSAIASAESAQQGSEENALDFSNQQPSRWISTQPFLGWTTGGMYNNLSYTGVPGQTFGEHVLYINEEFIALYAQDSTNEVRRLLPGQGVAAGPDLNQTANGSVTVTFTKLFDNPRGGASLHKHARYLKNLCDDFKVPGCYKWVNYGKILYRESNTYQIPATWSYKDLTDGATLHFTKAHVQIAVIYSITYNGTNYFIAGVYRFDIQ